MVDGRVQRVRVDDGSITVETEEGIPEVWQAADMGGQVRVENPEQARAIWAWVDCDQNLEEQPSWPAWEFGA